MSCITGVMYVHVSVTTVTPASARSSATEPTPASWARPVFT